MTSRTRLVVLALTVSVTWALVGAASALACPRDPDPLAAEPGIYGSNVEFFLDRVEITVCAEGLLSEQFRPPGPVKFKVTISIWGKVTRDLKFGQIGSFKSSAENGENAYIVLPKLRAKIKRRSLIRVKMTLRDPLGKKADTAREDATVPH